MTTTPAQPTRQADRLYHDLLSPAETADVRKRVRLIATDVVAPDARRIANGDERVDGFPRDVFDGLAAAGLYRLPFRSEVGGDDLTHPVTATAVAIEELAYRSSSVAAIFDVHCILAGNALTHGTGNELPRVERCGGESFVAAAAEDHRGVDDQNDSDLADEGNTRARDIGRENREAKIPPLLTSSKHNCHIAEM